MALVAAAAAMPVMISGPCCFTIFFTCFAIFFFVFFRMIAMSGLLKMSELLLVLFEDVFCVSAMKCNTNASKFYIQTVVR